MGDIFRAVRNPLFPTKSLWTESFSSVFLTIILLNSPQRGWVSNPIADDIVRIQGLWGLRVKATWKVPWFQSFSYSRKSLTSDSKIFDYKGSSWSSIDTIPNENIYRAGEMAQSLKTRLSTRNIRNIYSFLRLCFYYVFK